MNILRVMLVASLSTFWVAMDRVTCAADGNNVAVVVQFEGTSTSMCAPLREGERMDGIDALRKAGYVIETKDHSGSLGTAVCSINGNGGSASACLSSSGHWHYWQWTEAGWKESDVGASNRILGIGDADGWVWETTAKAEPPKDTTGRCQPRADSAMADNDGVGLATIGLTIAAASIPVGMLARRRGRR